MMASTLACIEESGDTIFSKFCDINPSSAKHNEFCEFKIPILWGWDHPPLGCVYIICQGAKEVYVGKTCNLGQRFHSYTNNWKRTWFQEETDHAANINRLIFAGAEAGYHFELWISVFKDESVRAVIEANIIRNYHPAWNNILYEGKDYRLKHTTCPECGMSGRWCSGSTCQGYNRMLYDEEFPSMPKEEVKSITHYPPRICPKCGYRVPADSGLPHCNGLILCPCGKWVI